MTEAATPNTALRAVRLGMCLSQDDLARLLRANGADGANKRLVQRWEAGETAAPRPAYARALERVTGLPIASLGFTIPVPGHDVATGAAPGDDTAPVGLPAAQPAARANFSGIWLSRYVYHSSGRGEDLIGLHYVVVLQHGNRLTADPPCELRGAEFASGQHRPDFLGNQLARRCNAGRFTLTHRASMSRSATNRQPNVRATQPFAWIQCCRLTSSAERMTMGACD